MSAKATFEDAIQSLEAEVTRLESGNMSLDESLASFERAIKLIKVCNERLDSAERRVRLLVEADDGSVTDKAFDGIEDEN